MLTKWFMSKIFITTTLVLFLCHSGISQSYLKRDIQFDSAGKYTLGSILDSIETQGNVTLGYNSNLFDKTDTLVIANESYELANLIGLLEKRYLFESTFKRSKKILLYKDNEPEVKPTDKKYFGYLKDSESKNPIPFGYIYYSEKTIFSDDNGYFELSLNSETKETIVVGAVGYQTDTLPYQSTVPVVIALKHINILDTFFVIGGSKENINKYLPPDGQILEIASINSYGSLTGEPDIVTSIRHFSSFDVGGEGRHGLSIRGGSSDQNLILLDNIPVFEFTHIGGFRSIFLSNLVQSASFHTSGISAKYGGKLSSVLDVKLKSPNLTKKEFSCNIGLDAASGTVNIPLVKNKLGLIVGGRTRLLRFIDQPLIENILNYNSVNLNFNDFIAKMTYQFSKEHQLSGIFYKGNDIFSFEKDDEIDLYRTFNSIGWGNTVYGLNYRGILSNKLSLQAHLSNSEYFFESRGSYSENPTISDLAYDVFSTSSNRVMTAKSTLKYYHKNKHQSSIGIELSSYQFSPNLFQSNLYKDEKITDDDLVKEDFNQSEFVIYTQHKILLSENTALSAGLRYLQLPFDSTTFNALEPRVALHIGNGNIRLKLDYTRIHQPIHLLINPGAGLPSDLWYPSNDLTAPQRSDQVSATLDFQLDKDKTLGLSIFNKSFSNLVEYTDPTDLLYNIIEPEYIQQVGITKLNIQDAINQGDGNARGGEVSYRFQSEKVIGWLNYGITFSTRQFEALNNGEPFVSRFDRRHSISSGISFKLNANQTLTAQWVYGSGFPYTLNNEVLVNPIDSTTQVIPAKRNAQSTRDFHHLDLRYAYRKSFNRFDAEISAGIYNVYNRKNPFFVYLREVPNEERSEPVNVSLLPILPSLKANILF